MICCKPIEGRGIFPGWICGQCRTYNGNQRTACKIGTCRHTRCDAAAGTGAVAYVDERGDLKVLK